MLYISEPGSTPDADYACTCQHYMYVYVCIRSSAVMLIRYMSYWKTSGCLLRSDRQRARQSIILGRVMDGQQMSANDSRTKPWFSAENLTLSLLTKRGTYILIANLMRRT